MYCNALERRQPMAYSVAQRVISKKDSIYDYCDDLSRKSKLLYNAFPLSYPEYFYRIWKRTSHFQRSRSIRGSKIAAWILSGHPCPKSNMLQASGEVMRVTENPDFFAGLPMQTAQAIVKQAVTDFNNAEIIEGLCGNIQRIFLADRRCHITKRTALLLSRSQTRMLFYIQKSPGSP